MFKVIESVPPQNGPEGTNSFRGQWNVDAVANEWRLELIQTTAFAQTKYVQSAELPFHYVCRMPTRCFSC